MRLRDLLIAPVPHFLIGCGIYVCVAGENVIHHVVLHGLLEQQPSHAVGKQAKRSLQRLCKKLRLEITRAFAVEIAAVEADGVLHKLVLCTASVTFTLFLHHRPHCIPQPDRMAAFSFCTQGIPSLKCTWRQKYSCFYCTFAAFEK